MNVDKPQMLIFIGIPASGKTSFYNYYFKENYIHINLDTLKTRYQEDLAIDEGLKNNENLVIDNTNVLKVEREKYITIGKENKIEQVFIFIMKNRCFIKRIIVNIIMLFI